MRDPGLWRRWRDTRAISETVGAIGGLLLLVFGLTGGISAWRLWQAHSVLDQAAATAVASEAQAGCWTAETSAQVAAVLQDGGLNPAAVAVTAYTGTPSPYGTPVTAGLRTTVSTDALFVGAGLWTEAAGAQGTSTYVPASTGSGPSACTAPTLATAAGAGTPATPAAPVITGVTFSQWTPAGATLTITGQDFGASMPTLIAAPNGGHDSAALAVHYGSIEAGYTGANTTNSDGLTYVSWSPTTLVVTYPGVWQGSTVPLNGGTLTVQVLANGLMGSDTVTVPANPLWPSQVTLTASPTAPAVGDSVTLTATANASVSETGLAIVIAPSGGGTPLATCPTGTTCTATVSAAAPGRQTYTAWMAPEGGGMSTAVAQAAPVTVTWRAPATPTVTGLTARGDTVTVTGQDLPVFSPSQGQAVSYGWDFPNFLWAQGSPPPTWGAEADGNPTVPYQPDWGVTIVQSTATTLVFTVPSGNPPTGVWSLYLVPAGESVSTETAAVWTGTVASYSTGGTYA